MSLWDSFKREINQRWSGADFWDEEENERQRQQFAQPQPTPSNTGGLKVGVAQPTQTITVAPPQAQPDIEVPEAPVIPKNRYVGFDLDEGKNKTIFGWNAAALLPKGYEKTYGVKTGREFEADEGTFLKQFDNLDDEFRNKYVNDLNALAQQGNENAKRTVETLTRAGKLKGDFSDFVAGANDKFIGGLSRGGMRTVDFVLPGKNTFGMEQLANQQDPGRVGTNQVTEAGRRGETVGTVAKGTADIATLVAPGMIVDKFAKAARFANTGSKAVNFVARTAPGSVASSAVDFMQEVGRGNDPNAARSFGVGLVADLATPVLLKPIGKAVKGGRNQISKLLNRGADDVVEEAVDQADNIPVMVKFSDDLRNAPNINPQLSKVSSQNIEFGADTLGSDLDANTVAQYVDDIRAGRGIDPLVVTKEGDKVYLQDGKHRMAALQAVGVDELPVVYRETPQVVAQAGEGAVKGKTQSIGDLLPDLTARKEVTQSMDKILSDRFGVAESTVRRLRNGYGDEAAQNILARSSDATNIRDMDAFVISEARKAYGSPNVRIERPTRKPSDVSPEELASLEATAPKVDETFTPKVPEAPAVKVEESKLGSMAEAFYEQAKGNKKIKFTNLEQLGKNISRQIDDDFNAIGSDFSEVARKVQEAVRNGAKTLDEAGITPEEAGILRKAQAEMNYIRRRASLGKREIGSGDFGELYLPQQKQGQYGGEKLFEGFRDTKPGSEFKRGNKIELEDLDYSPDVVGQYVARYGDTKLYQQERIARALAKNNPNVDEEVVQKAAQEVIEVQNKVNQLKTKIGAFGFGSRKTLSEGKFLDTAAEMNKVGKTLGKPQTDVIGAPQGLTNGDRINSIEVGDTNVLVGDYLGLNQYRDAGNFASAQVMTAGGNRDELARAVEQRLLSNYNLPAEDVEYIVSGISRIAKDVPDEVVLAKVTGTYRQAAKQQLLEQLQTVNIKNSKLRRDVSDLANQILREGTIEEELSNKVVRSVLKTTNAIFRKLNVSSAINELSDLTSFLSVYGKDTSLIPDFKAVKEFGLGDIDPAIEPYIKQIQEGVSLPKVLKSINKGTNLYKFVETYKAGVVASSAKKFYGKQGMAGDELVGKVLEDYRTLALPVDAFTKTFLDKAPLYTQYMTWGVRNLQKEGRLARGKIAAGQLIDKTTMERVARNAYANLPAKTVFWLSSNALKGTAIMTAFGLTDFTGLTNQDYSGIAEEDKSFFDKTTQFTNTSTTFSLLNKVIQSYEKERLQEKYADKDYNPYEDTRLDKDVMAMFTPQFVKNIQGTNEMVAQGYSENKGGRVQYEAPTDFWNLARSWVFGKGQTDQGREYSGRENIIDRVADGGNPVTSIIDMAKEQIGLQDTDYTRPLTEKYSEAYKEADTEGRKALLAGGRAFNGFLDNLQKDSPDAYNTYIKSMDGNHVNPEYWKAIAGGDSGKPDLTIFNMVKNRKKQLAKDLGEKYDPIYDLTDDQARAVLQQKAVATGDDIALRNSLYKEKWYQDYMDKVKGYYDDKEETDSDFEQTQRVKDWYGFNDQYNSLRTTADVNGKRPDWSQKFPTVYAQKVINQQYGFDSDQSKAFFSQYGDQYKAEKEAYDAENLALINKMREIEGYPAMSTEQYAQVTEIADTDTSDDKQYGRGGSRGTGLGDLSGADFGQVRSLDLPSVKIKRSKVTAKQAYKPKAVKIQRNKKVA